MGKIKKLSIKWCFLIYLPFCFIMVFLGSMGIGIATNALQDWYRKIHSEEQLYAYFTPEYEIYFDENGIPRDKYIITDLRPVAEKKYIIIYFIISNAQFILIPLWVIFCVAVTGIIFYNRELKKPISILMDASKKISENQLDFQIDYKNQNELGMLCNAFEDMRKALDENNREMWHSLEERKRLNSAFSHDLRTPLTVLRGYNEFLQKYNSQISEEKLMNVLSKMNMQIQRLENYTYKMSAVQKLEDVIPELSEVSAESLKENLSESGKLICKDKDFLFNFNADEINTIILDTELVSEVYENLLSNAVRYAESRITADIKISDKKLIISVSDDGRGFSEKALKLASEPFFRGDTEQNSSHSGLGLYICRIICGKSGGTLKISNTENGAKVTAEFIFQKLIKS